MKRENWQISPSGIIERRNEEKRNKTPLWRLESTIYIYLVNCARADESVYVRVAIKSNLIARLYHEEESEKKRERETRACLLLLIWDFSTCAAFVEAFVQRVAKIRVLIFSEAQEWSKSALLVER